MRISTIIPVWNRVQLISRAIKSVLMQSYPPDELIVVDDASTDMTSYNVDEIIKSYRGSIHLWQLKLTVHSGMPGKVRNEGMRHARNDWIAFLDSDDEWHTQKLEKQILALELSKKRWCHAREEWNRNGKIISQKSHTHKRQGNIFEDALQKCIIGPSTVLLHKQLCEELGYFREDLEICEDYELWLRFCDKYPIDYVDESLITKYAGHSGQLSEKYDYIENFRIEALRPLIENNIFSYNNKKIATQELKRKTAIWEQGKIRHGNTDI